MAVVLRRRRGPGAASADFPPPAADLAPFAEPPLKPPPDRTRRVALIVAIICLAALVGGGAGAFANDAFARAHLLPGTRIAGVYVGGEKLADAQQKLTRIFVDPLRQPFVINAADVATETTRWDLGMHVDVRTVLHQAYERQQNMRLWERARAWIRGDKTGNGSIDPLLDRATLERTIDTIARRVQRPVQDASLSFDGGRLVVVPDHTGRQLDVAAANKRLTAALSSDAGSVQLPVQVTYAAHRASDFARVVVIHGGSNRLDLYIDGEVAKSYPVATGQPAYPTPMGSFFIVSKQVNPMWINPHSSWSVGMPEYVPPGPNNPLGTRAMQIDADAVYIHGSPDDSSIGSHASHGCIRMHMPDAEDLFNRVSIGTPVLIVPS